MFLMLSPHVTPCFNVGDRKGCLSFKRGMKSAFTDLGLQLNERKLVYRRHCVRGLIVQRPCGGKTMVV